MTAGNKITIFAVCIGVLIITTLFLPVTDWIVAVLEWIQVRPELSWLVFFFFYVIATVLLLPGSILTLGAGFLFTLPAGVVLVSISSVTGASLAFLLGRYLARDWIVAKMNQLQNFKKLDQAVSRQGFLIVFLARLSPVFPFNLLNYGMGLTSVKFLHYLFASWIGMLPGTIMYVYLGSAAKSLVALVNGDIQTGAASRALLFTGLAATVVLTLVITRIATRSLRSHLQDEE